MAVGISSKREAELAGQGWTRRTVQAEPRLGELVEEYRAVGFEVFLEPFQAQAGDECVSCLDFPSVGQEVKIIYTRPAGHSGGGDLF